MPFQELHKPLVLPVRKNRRDAAMTEEARRLVLHVRALVQQGKRRLPVV
jgi:hypothetical protein